MGEGRESKEMASCLAWLDEAPAAAGDGYIQSIQAVLVLQVVKMDSTAGRSVKIARFVGKRQRGHGVEMALTKTLDALEGYVQGERGRTKGAATRLSWADILEEGSDVECKCEAGASADSAFSGRNPRHTPRANPDCRRWTEDSVSALGGDGDEDVLAEVEAVSAEAALCSRVFAWEVLRLRPFGVMILLMSPESTARVLKLIPTAQDRLLLPSPTLRRIAHPRIDWPSSPQSQVKGSL